MKIIILTILTFILVNLVNAQQDFYSNLEVTRISSNFAGSAYNGNTIIVYGDGGIIMRSINGGEKWEKIILPDSLGIVGMTNIGTKFFGLCSQRFGITSEDNGLTWNFIDYGDKTQFFQLIRSNSQNYALLNYNVWKLDDNFSKTKEYTFTSDTSYFNFTVAGNQIVISSGKGMLTFINTDNDQKNTQPLSDFGGCDECPLISNLISNNTNLIFFRLNSKLIRLNLTTKKLDTLTNLRKIKGGAYNFLNGELKYIYTLKQVSQLDSLFFQQIDLSVGTYKRINVSEKERYINGLSFQSISAISSDTIVAVGNNNLIYMSFDSGVHWELKSYLGNIFKIYQFDKLNYRAIGPYGTFYKSKDGAITWLPSIDYYQEFFENSGFGDPVSWGGTYSFKDNNNGFVFYPASNVNEKNCSFTRNGGDNIKIKYTHELYTRFNSYSLENNGKYLFYQWGCLGWDLGCWTVMFQLNDTLGIEKKVSTRGLQMFFADKNKNGFWGIGKDTALPDNIYTVLKSSNGLNWSKDFTFQIETPLIVNSENAVLIDDYIYASWSAPKIEQNDTFLVQRNYRIELKNRTSKNVLEVKADGLWKIVKIKNEYYISYYYFDPINYKPVIKMLTTDNIESENVNWTELPFKRFGVPNLVSSLNDSNLIYSVYDSLFRTNAIYMGKIDRQTDVEVSIERIGQLYLSNPMPQPASTSIKMKVFWDQRLNIDEANIVVFDLKGETVSSNSEFLLNKTNNYSGEIYWKTSQLQSGVYILVISVGDITASTLVVISK